MFLSGRTISLEEAIQTARVNNLSLQRARYEMEAARWSYLNSRTQFGPRMNLAETTVIFDEALTTEIDFSFLMPGLTPITQTLREKEIYSTSFQVDQILFTGGMLYSANRLSKIQYDMMVNNYHKKLQETDAQVTENYYLILQIHSTIDILNNHLRLCRDLKNTTQVMFDNGIGLETDVMQWELRIIEIENSLLNIENNLANLKNLTKILVQDKIRICSLFFFLCLFLYPTSFGQNRHFTIGYKSNGLTFGNSVRTNGIRLNFLDKNVDRVNGLNLAVISKSRVSNGFTLGLIWNEHSICNGIVIKSLAGESEKVNGILINGLFGRCGKVNGIFISGLAGGTDKINGLGIAGFIIVGGTLNGLLISPFSIDYWNDKTIGLINGVAVGGILGTSANKLNGLSISLLGNRIDELNGISIGLFNRSENLRGVQIGILNIAKNNKYFKYTPIINFNFRKN